MLIKDYTQGSNIGWAVASMNHGHRVRRAGWSGWIALQVPDENSANTKPYVYSTFKDGGRVPWTCMQEDLLAIDWQLVDAVQPGSYHQKQGQAA